ncbi:patatin [Erysipelothrix larvae]|uniref:Patatin n=1 Tax=Erysipelothrix larvae TaxID=1514105 RepID=A0A0X8H1K9_9FIRM|nr:patatin-like phospholipase family protein [Erysipelothrix larvae]AMC94434.1 patatin [Erysipelothrix larvae]
MSVGIALSGGGIKSFSQLPVLEALHKKGINIDYYAGTSMGAAIAALAASGLELEVMIPLALEVEELLLKQRVFSRPSLRMLPFSKNKIHAGYVDGEVIETIIDPIFQEHGISNIRDVKVPLAIPSVDILTGKLIVFVSHPELFNAHKDWIVISDVKLSLAVRASCSFPFIISAVPYDNYLLTDGGVKMNLPLDLVEAYGATKTVAVTMHQDSDFTEYDRIQPLANRVMDLMAGSKDELVVGRADVHINIPLNDIWVFDIGKGIDTITAGEQIMEEYQKSLETLIKKPTFWEKLFNLV